jgi:hypothetical protein
MCVCVCFVFVAENKCVSVHHVEQVVLGCLVGLSIIIYQLVFDFKNVLRSKYSLISCDHLFYYKLIIIGNMYDYKSNFVRFTLKIKHR